ncbi:flavin reductase family protein [Streptomyces sp. JJ36]|uniref:flavin reductase family protein n=1 Tax=Streptomyces sp. JJ36 TaxID=2736645 RepID=UPI001F2C75BA|nr:flavin reductase family protein [Streptomyces sp. JJ36]MCF6525790.1 flavin reductase family protein [Streptomyces sp. JJ36]
MPVVDPAEFTRALARVPSPVTVATTVDPRGRRWGFTASSFSSLSLDPPLVLVCPARTADCHDAFVSADRFMVNVLAAGQAGLARHFARSGHDKFAAGDTVPCELALPGVPGAAARLGCALHAVLDGGDHSILVGRVETAVVGDQEPLVYHDRTFTRPEPVPAALAPAR